jgi:hypothetical protein
MLKLISLLSFAVLFTSCWRYYNPDRYAPKKVLGYKPVYSNDSSLLNVRVSGPQPVKFPGKIYVKGNFIFQNELGKGIHVIDNTDPSATRQIGFISLLGNSEMSIKGDYIYANSFADLVIIHIADWQNVKEEKRIRNAFYQGSVVGAYNFIPLPEHKVYYECPNYFSGILTGWVKDSVYNYSCYYP